MTDDTSQELMEEVHCFIADKRPLSIVTTYGSEFVLFYDDADRSWHLAVSDGKGIRTWWRGGHAKVSLGTEKGKEVLYLDLTGGYPFNILNPQDEDIGFSMDGMRIVIDIDVIERISEMSLKLWRRPRRGPSGPSKTFYILLQHIQYCGEKQRTPTKEKENERDDIHISGRFRKAGPHQRLFRQHPHGYGMRSHNRRGEKAPRQIRRGHIQAQKGRMGSD